MTGLLDSLWASLPYCTCKCMDKEHPRTPLPAQPGGNDFSGEVSYDAEDGDISSVSIPADLQSNSNTNEELPQEEPGSVTHLQPRRYQSFHSNSSMTDLSASCYESKTTCSSMTLSTGLAGGQADEGGTAEMEAKKQRWQARRQEKQRRKSEKTGSVTYGKMLREHGWMLQWRLSNQMLCELEGMLNSRGILVSQLEQVGSGRFARVFRGCWQTKHEDRQDVVQDVAIKWMRPTLPSFSTGGSGTTPLWLKREVEANQAVQHPHLVQMLHSVLDQQPYIIILEYCAGGNLESLLHSTGKSVENFGMGAGVPTWVQRWKIALDISAGMAHLHSLRVIHRDLKPPNVLLQRPLDAELVEPHCKVGDFGLARFMEEDKNVGMSVEVGSAVYIAPEMYRRVSCDQDTKQRYSEKVDVYSYSMLLYELLSGKTPFAEVVTSLEHLVASGVRPQEKFIPEDAPPLLVTLMKACWAGHPPDRPAFADVAIGLSRTYESVGTISVSTRTPSINEKESDTVMDSFQIAPASSLRSLQSIPEGSPA
mmetsp:Transcript_30567/g.71393  ORF Transcript_30567/g.71393 Transcript_30567/m.71393 type:complete len:536 (+) Transcript_30567:3-1610(+)|eukprot:CAMPEP_0178401842 /NCGR_PEP_ID=MMETSP0689_2-20121128/16517_1 /TAXON_ID=160604 /ORGANISM="Amphidinium massartii, Strain CS-259" /LENGTH=535 /DNA_ID=CAMNT_0020022689 /DNA_START=138 /DNA_END=1745 /DNA_ORIENTATION=-